MNSTIKPVSDFDALSEDQRDQLHDWLDEGLGYHKTMAKLKDEFGFVITYNKLYRYDQRRLEKRSLSEHLDHEISLPEYLALLNGHPVAYASAGLEAIQKRAFEMIHDPKPSPTKLATLQRILHYKTARADVERREARADQRMVQAEKRLLQNDRRNEIAEATLRLKQEEHADRRAARAHKTDSKKGACQKNEDHLGPLATNLEQASERLRILFGVSKEEWARRQALPDNYDEDENLNETNAHPSPGGARVLPSPDFSPLAFLPADASPSNALLDSPEGTSSASPTSPSRSSRGNEAQTSTAVRAARSLPLPSSLSLSSATTDTSLGVPPLGGPCSPMQNEKCSLLDAQWNSPISAASACSALIPSTIK